MQIDHKAITKTNFISRLGFSVHEKKYWNVKHTLTYCTFPLKLYNLFMKRRTLPVI